MILKNIPNPTPFDPFEWFSLDNARRFFESPELVEIRKKAGVRAPDFIYLHEIERGVL